LSVAAASVVVVRVSVAVPPEIVSVSAALAVSGVVKESVTTKLTG
jgi:hypothetical protein